MLFNTLRFLAPLGFLSMVSASSYTYERLNKNDSLLLIVDLQEGLYNLARDSDPTLYRDNIIAHAALGQLFNLPVVMTASEPTGPNGPLPAEIVSMYPNAPLIIRSGEVDAWDNPDFKAAVQAANKSQIILAGIATDVCTTFLSLSLRDAGYSVWANIEASGTTSTLIRDMSNARMQQAGVQMVSLFSIVCDLMRDWRNVPGAAEVIPWLDQYAYPVYGWLARQHKYAVDNGTVIPGEATLPQ